MELGMLFTDYFSFLPWDNKLPSVEQLKISMHLLSTISSDQSPGRDFSV